jgi:hypothetical protein
MGTSRPQIVPFQPSARSTSGVSKVNGGRWERRGEGEARRVIVVEAMVELRVTCNVAQLEGC